MKKVTLNGKLSLTKETIVKLNGEQLNEIQGGLPVAADLNNISLPHLSWFRDCSHRVDCCPKW